METSGNVPFPSWDNGRVGGEESPFTWKMHGTEAIGKGEFAKWVRSLLTSCTHTGYDSCRQHGF